MGAILAEALVRRWREFAETVARPSSCVFCAHPRVLWNGWRTRSASVECAGEVVHVPRIRCRRVRCRECRRSWTLRPPGLMPQRHYQLSVMALAVARYVSQPAMSQARVAARVGCARRTIRRWLRWLAGVAEPGDLLRHLYRICGEVVVPALSSARAKLEAIGDGARRRLCERAAENLGLFEALAMALGLEPPGLGSVVEAVLANRSGITSDRSPRIPEFARRQPRGGWAMLGV